MKRQLKKGVLSELTDQQTQVAGEERGFARGKRLCMFYDSISKALAHRLLQRATEKLIKENQYGHEFVFRTRKRWKKGGHRGFVCGGKIKERP